MKTKVFFPIYWNIMCMRNINPLRVGKIIGMCVIACMHKIRVNDIYFINLHLKTTVVIPIMVNGAVVTVLDPCHCGHGFDPRVDHFSIFCFFILKLNFLHKSSIPLLFFCSCFQTSDTPIMNVISKKFKNEIFWKFWFQRCCLKF